MFESYTYREKIRPSEIKSLLLRLIISDPSNYDQRHTCKALMEAFVASMTARENQKKPLALIEGAKAAEALFLEVFEKVYGEEDLQPGVAEWPEVLPYDYDLVYPKSVIVIVAQALAQKEKIKREAWYKYCREHLGEDSPYWSSRSKVQNKPRYDNDFNDERNKS